MKAVHSSKQGVALIVVLGVLVILALLATTFASLQAVERSVARNYLRDSEATMIARSGIVTAVEGYEPPSTSDR